MNRRKFLASWPAGLMVGSQGLKARTGTGDESRRSTALTDALPGRLAGIEPNAEIASAWWPDLENFWTPVGWKDHLFRFTVFYDGTLLAQPNMHEHTNAWKGQGVQLTFLSSGFGWELQPTHDDHRVRQGWRDCAAPVLWSEWAPAATEGWKLEGYLLRQEIFAHIAGGKEVASGAEPLFAWVRLLIAYACPALPLEKNTRLEIKVNAPYISTFEIRSPNIEYHPELSAYPRKLSPDPDGPLGTNGWRLVEEDGKVRLGIAPGPACTISYAAGKPTDKDGLLGVTLDLREHARVDLLVPMLPTEREVFERELALGYDRALEEANAYWSRRPVTAALVDTPEPLVNEAVRHNLKFAQVVAEKNPEDGLHYPLSGTLNYARLWSTTLPVHTTMFLDVMGYHSEIEKYLEAFKHEQGRLKPLGEGLGLHPGYLSTPRRVRANDWFSDHGAILYAVCEHALLTGHGTFTDRWIEAIVKGCEFIQYARASKNHKGVQGVMPAGRYSDNETAVQSIWIDGWTYKGLTTAVKVLRQVQHPRAEEFSAEARAYKESFTEAFRARAATAPRWKDSQGREHPLVPPALSGDQPWETRMAFYLDTGPLFLVFSGLMDAQDELMKSTLLWFREGPQRRMARSNSNLYETACLFHEISSCEPGFSWNVFHSHATADRGKFLEGMYSLFCGGASRQTFTGCEGRGGRTGVMYSGPTLGTYLVRLAVVDDQIRENELHLLRFLPLAWLRPERETRFEQMPTHFGPVTVTAGLSAGKETLNATFKPQFRTPPGRVVLHVPPITGLNRITLNGRPLHWNGVTREVVLVDS